MIKQANWIKSPVEMGDICPVFKKTFTLPQRAAAAKIYISALGVYEAELNGRRIGDFILAPGWTSYGHRVQYQEYDVGDFVNTENTLEITLGRGWCGPFTWYRSMAYPYPSPAIICALQITFPDGSEELIYSDESFEFAKSNILFSDIYDGEVYDSRAFEREWAPAAICDYPKEILIPQQGEIVREIEEIRPVDYIKTIVGDKFIDFGQNLTGYVKFKTNLPSGTVVEYRHAEVLKGKGTFTFYTENLRNAQQKVTCIANGEETEYKPHFTFQGFRYIRLDKWPGDVNLDDFRAVVVHSDIKRTGYFECSNEKVNKLFQNIIWGQKGNFLDVPTDCPQRDERCGWTGDAQVFVRAASYNFDVKKFFTKWLADVAADQFDDGGIPAIVPNMIYEMYANSAAWGDAAVICPWQIYLTYGDKDLLATQFDCMQNWVNYIRSVADADFLWTEDVEEHFGDWLALDNGEGVNDGATPKELIATAYFAYSTCLLIKAGKILGKDMSEYESLYENIAAAFQKAYIQNGKMTSGTQTAHALALYFDLCGDSKESIAKNLADKVVANGNKLDTGFVGTPYLLHVLSQNGYPEIAYSLLLQEEFPSWLYSVNKGATTVWEHWDGLKDDGSFWSPAMNSFNHYAFGAVADWMYGVVCGINTDENAPGFEHAVLRPVPDRRLGYAAASIDTQFGRLSSKWTISGDKVLYEFEVPNSATVIIGDNTYEVGKGSHQFEDMWRS